MVLEAYEDNSFILFGFMISTVVSVVFNALALVGPVPVAQPKK